MSAMDRGADLTWIAPLTYIHVEHIRLDPTSTNAAPIMIVQARVRISQSIRIKKPLLTDAENVSMRQAVSDEKDGSAVSNSKLLSRFSDEENFLVTGNPMESVLGLSHLLGVEDHAIQSAKVKGIKELEREILASGEQEVIQNMKYVIYQAASESHFSNGIRDLNNAGKRLADFVNHPTAKEYKLREEHIAALRIYTTSAFRFINNLLRNNNSGNEKERKTHPFPVTVSLIDDAIKRLRASTAKSFEANSSSTCSSEVEENNCTYLWRGIKNMKISEEFIKGGKGGTELGLMSTTRDLKIAVEYSKGFEGNALLFN